MLLRIAKFAESSALRDWIVEDQQQVLGEVARLTHSRLFKVRPQEVTNVVWALGELGPNVLKVPMGRLTIESLLVKALNQACEWRVLEKVRCADLALLVSGIAKLDLDDIQEEMKDITDVILKKLVKFKDHDIPVLVSGLAIMGWRDYRKLLSAIAVECKKRVGGFRSKELANLLWAFAALEFHDIQHLLWISATQTLPHLKEFSPQEIVKIVWGYNTLMYYPGEKSLSKLSVCLAPNVKKLIPLDLAHTMFSFANMGLEDRAAVNSLCDCLTKNLIEGGLPAREAAVIGWSLAVLDSLDKLAFVSLRRFFAEIDADALPERHKADIYRFLLHLQIFRPQLSGMISVEALGQYQQSWMKLQSKWEPPKRFTELLPVLKRMGYSCNPRESIADGLMVASTARSGGKTFVVEVITPPNCYSTYMPTETPYLSGSFLWRERVLMALGWRVLRVNERTWKELVDNQDRAAYLNERIGHIYGGVMDEDMDSEGVCKSHAQAA